MCHVHRRCAPLARLHPGPLARGERAPQQGGGFTTGNRNEAKPLEKGCGEHAAAAPETEVTAVAARGVLWDVMLHC